MVGSCRVMKKVNVTQGVALVAIDLCRTNKIFRFLLSKQLSHVLNGIAQRSSITTVVSGHLQWLNGPIIPLLTKALK